MLPDLGWSEILVIAIVLIVVVGPKDLPKMLRAFGKTTANLRKVAGDFRKQFDEALKEAELDDVRKIASDMRSLDPRNQIKDVLNPLGKIGQDINSELKKAAQEIDKPDVPKSATATALDDAGAKMRAAQEKPKAEPAPAKPAETPAAKPAKKAAKPAAKPAVKAAEPVAVAPAKVAEAKPKAPKAAPKKAAAPAAAKPKAVAAAKPRARTKSGEDKA